MAHVALVPALALFPLATLTVFFWVQCTLGLNRQ
jgi:hypothetical protein